MEFTIIHRPKRIYLQANTDKAKELYQFTNVIETVFAAIDKKFGDEWAESNILCTNNEFISLSDEYVRMEIVISYKTDGLRVLSTKIAHFIETEINAIISERWHS